MTVAGMRQPWDCDQCGSRGVVPVRDGAGVYEVVEQLRADHHRLDGTCADEFDVSHVRIRVEE